jgi:hypothetical protein
MFDAAPAAPAPAPAPTLPYCRPTFSKSKKVNIRVQTFLLIIFYDCNSFLIQFVLFFQNLSRLNIGFGAGAVGAGTEAVYRCGFGSDSNKMTRLLEAPAPQTGFLCALYTVKTT